MPVNAVEIKNRKITQFSASLDDEGIDIEGNYKVTIENTGLVPSPSTSFKAINISHSGSGTTIISERDQSNSRLSPGSTTDISIPFTVNGSESDLMELAESGCSESMIGLNVKESITGILLVSTVEEEVSVETSSSECSLTRDTQNGGGNSSNDSDTPSVNLNIDGPEEVSSGESNSWTITGNNLASVDQFRVVYGDGTNETTESRTITHTYSDNRVYVIVVEAILDGESVASRSQRISVTESDDEPMAGIDYAVQINGPDEVVRQQQNQWEAMPIEASNSGVYYEFEMGDGSNYNVGETSENNTVTHTYTAAGSYDITVTMYDSDTDEELDSDAHTVQAVGVSDTTSSLPRASIDYKIPSMSDI